MNKKEEEEKKKSAADKIKDHGKSFLYFDAVKMSTTTNPAVKGYDFNKGINYNEIFQSYKTMGFQASELAKAIDRINEMLRWRLSDEPKDIQKKILDDLAEKYYTEKDISYIKNQPNLSADQVKTTIFFGYTSNMVSCGNREIIRYLCQHKLIDVIVTTAGGIEEDFLKCYNPHYMGNFSLKGETLRKQGLNRIGNLIVPNDNYTAFEDFCTPIFNQMLKEQINDNILWTPCKIIHRLGKEINNEESIYYWCYKNDIPVFCPAITDGSIGDILFFHSLGSEQSIIVDLIEDIRRINLIAMNAPRSGQIILGGGLVKHHICNANLMRNGADYSVFINTAQPYDGSDAGAIPDEAISWGKIKMDARPVKVYAENTLVFPIIVAETFAKYHQEQQNNN